MTKNLKINAENPFVGEWVGEGEDSRCHYTIKNSETGLSVYAVDVIDGEEMVINDVTFDGKYLKFTSLMPSTGRVGQNVMRLISDKEIEFKFTFTVTEIWHKI